jgi:hypothetical protein
MNGGATPPEVAHCCGFFILNIWRKLDMLKAIKNETVFRQLINIEKEVCAGDDTNSK